MPYKDKEKRKEQNKKWYLKNRELVIARASKWNKENKERRKDIVTKNNNQEHTKLRKLKWHEQKVFEGRATIIDKKCEICGSNKQLVIHHKDGCNGRFGKSLNNQPDNLVVLCRSCHPRVHNVHWIKEIDAYIAGL